MDDRCLFETGGNPLYRSFETITRECREGEGLWERCRHCGLAINRSGVDPAKQGEFYNTTYVEDHSYVEGEVLSARRHFDERIDSVRPIADGIRPYLKKDMNVLEVGAATGELLYLLKDEVASCHGNEINKTFVRFMKDDLGFQATHDDYMSLSFESRFDFIITINSVDHIFNTGAIVAKMHKDLRPGGKLYIEVPNDDQALKTFLPEASRHSFQKFMYQKAHYYSFSFATLRRLLVQCGFTIEKEFSRHDYTIVNYLRWYHNGKPTSSLSRAALATDIHDGNSDYEVRMNKLFAGADKEFRRIMAETGRGETLCMLAVK